MRFLTKMHLILILVGITGCMGTNRDLFRRTALQKCGRFNRINNCSWDYGLCVEYLKKNQQSAIQNKIEEHFVRFFQQIKVRQPNGRKDSKQTIIPTSRRLDSFLYKAAQNFDSCQIFNIKNKK